MAHGSWGAARRGSPKRCARPAGASVRRAGRVATARILSVASRPFHAPRSGADPRRSRARGPLPTPWRPSGGCRGDAGSAAGNHAPILLGCSRGTPMVLSGIDLQSLVQIDPWPLLLSILVGGLIGLEREMHGR